MPEPAAPPTSATANPAKEIYLATDSTTQELIKAILQQEREVQHLKRRPDIHKNILDILKRTVQ
ncbi:MAG: hypothetical protein RL693_867 [Verrucomicrobiota bacterium]|jgi:hypothetical protein